MFLLPLILFLSFSLLLLLSCYYIYFIIGRISVLFIDVVIVVADDVSRC